MNTVTLIGNIGRAPEMRTAASGTPIAKFSVATTERKKVGDTWEAKTQWHNITAFGRHAEMIAEQAVQGSRVFIEGKLNTNSYEHEGVKKYRTEVIVTEMLVGIAKAKKVSFEDEVPF